MSEFTEAFMFVWGAIPFILGLLSAMILLATIVILAIGIMSGIIKYIRRIGGI